MRKIYFSLVCILGKTTAKSDDKKVPPDEDEEGEPNEKTNEEAKKPNQGLFWII